MHLLNFNLSSFPAKDFLYEELFIQARKRNYMYIIYIYKLYDYIYSSVKKYT